MDMKRISIAIAAALIAAACLGCASGVEQDLDLARFALDRGDWDDAILHAQAAFTADPTNLRAMLDLSSGYAGRSGFKTLPLLAAIADERSRTDMMHAIREAVGSTITNIDDLRRAIEVLQTDIEPSSSEYIYYVDYYFQLGVFTAIEGIALAPLHAQPVPGGPIDVNSITEVDRVIEDQDLRDADEFLVEGGLPADNEIIVNIRQTFCALVRASTVPEGFDLAALRDMTLCQLSPDDGAALAPGDFQSPAITSCSDFDYSLCEEAEAL